MAKDDVYVAKGTGAIVARIVGDSIVMDEVTNEIRENVIAVAVAGNHIDTGNYINELKVLKVPGKRGVTDRLLLAGDIASMSIEYGHSVLIENPSHNGADWLWVPGLALMRQGLANTRGTSHLPGFGQVKGRVPYDS